MAAIAAVAVWRVLSLSKSLAAVTAENTALKLDLEKARNTDAVELATTRQALESLRSAKAETEEAYARRVDQLAAEPATTAGVADRSARGECTPGNFARSF